MEPVGAPMEGWSDATGVRHPRDVARTPETPTALACLQCGTPAARADVTFCRRCGLPYGAPPRSDVELPVCPICYATVDDDGRLPSLDHPGLRVDLVRHQAEHDRHPVGDDDWLETLREGDRVRVGRWTAPFDVVRRYLVTGQVEAGRQRQTRPRRDRHRDDAAPTLGPRDGDLRRSARLGGRPPRRVGAHGALRPTVAAALRRPRRTRRRRTGRSPGPRSRRSARPRSGR